MWSFGFKSTYLLSLSLRLLSVKRGDDKSCFPRSVPKSSEMPRQILAQVPQRVSGYFSGCRYKGQQ